MKKHELKRILAASDLSAAARHAAERAALVSRATALPLDLCHVANLAPLERLRQLMGATPTDMAKRVLDAAQQKLGELAASLRERYGVAAGTHVVAGSLLKELVSMADALAADLLVCGAKGESVIRPFVVGTTAMRVLSTATRPVLVVKQPPHEPYRRLLVPVDFSAASLATIHLARTIAPGVDLVLLHAFEEPFEGQLRYASVDEETINQYRLVARQEAAQKLDALRGAAGLSPDDARLVVLHGDPALCIVNQEQEYDCDLIVMGKHGENLFEELLLGSVTRHVLTESQGDVLISV